MKKGLLAISLAVILMTGCGDETTTEVIKIITLEDVVVEKVSNDTRHTMILNTDGTLYAAGWNEVGGLGDGIASEATLVSPTEVMTSVESVSCGYNNTMIIKEDGTLWGTGENSEGQLGLGTTDDVSSFTQAVDSNGNYMTDVALVSAGFNATLVVKDDGTLWAAGDNFHGKLGNGASGAGVLNNSFTQVLYQNGIAITNVSNISMGSYSALVALTDGTLLAAGDNWFGQLGLGDNTARVYFTQVTGITDVVDVASGAGHSVVLKSDGTVWGVGTTSVGQLGLAATTADSNNFVQLTDSDGNNITGVAKVEAEEYTTMLVKEDGTLLATGENFLGHAGNGTTTNIEAFTQVATGISTEDGSVATGQFTSFAINTDGILLATGDNWFGTCANGLAGADMGYTEFTAVTE